ncbi:Uu.00g032230.m01.CDS01 [Anthostomella pinea]|uniref:Uu.00g032230.m01.CDS01 n=1 Tax=Anthostomella pinea TaxID=933095 RepID=A0AAI8YD47_9PEZI|nr:Uu.00g032230.m01.CDS01 [Anthostomella pinea]
MDSPASTRGRGRGSARKRHTFPARSLSQKDAESTQAAETMEQFPSRTPTASLPSSSFSFETPSPSASRGPRTRTRIVDSSMPSPDDADTKGGRSLRKRARVDYTFDHVEEDATDATTSAALSGTGAQALKKRKTDLGSEDAEAHENSDAQVKRRASEQLPPPLTTRRRSQLRKATVEPQPYVPEHHMEDVEVQDTIEVGGHHSESSDASNLRRTSSGSSSNDAKSGPLPISLNTFTLFHPSPEANHSHEAGESFPVNQLMRRGSRTSGPEPPAIVVEQPPRTSYEHLTPYVDGAVVYHPLARPDGAEPDAAHEGVLEEDAVEDQVDGTVADTPAGSPGPADTAANSPTAEAGIPWTQRPLKKPIAFRQPRKPSEFTQLLDDIKSQSPEEAYRRLEVVNRALAAWQNEYNELRKITDDEDNSQRYHQEEAAFQHRQKMAISKDPDANPVRKDFVVKGIRASKPDPFVAYTRQQDRIMANSYLFEYDDRDIKIGLQDPIAQRGGVGKGRLRDRPKQTAKAAESDDPNVVVGKRSRKAPTLFDGVEAASSRGSTPVPVQRRRRRADQSAEDIDEASLAVPDTLSSSAEQVTPKKKGKGGRPRKHPLPTTIPEDKPAPVENLKPEPQPEPESEPVVEPTRSIRKRLRRAPVAEEEEEASTNGANSHALLKPGPRRVNSRISEVPSGSFYTISSMASTNAANESRPATSSSTGTVSTVASNSYQFRDKRQKKFSLDASDEEYEEQPKPKRVRRPTKKAQVEDFAPTPVPVPAPVRAPEPTPVPMQQAVADAVVASKPYPQIKLKLKNYHPPTPVPVPIPHLAPTSAPISHPFSILPANTPTPSQTSNGNSNGIENGPNGSDYNTLTKSEKMSQSMKARWANGSMDMAVAKRRATLKAKKEAVKQAEPGLLPETIIESGQQQQQHQNQQQ